MDDSTLSAQPAAIQRVLKTLLGKAPDADLADPDVQSWMGYEETLCGYGIVVCVEQKIRGGEGAMLGWFREQSLRLQNETPVHPPWIGQGDIHAEHRSALLAIDEGHYRSAGFAD